jgi:hypothetical protein
MDFVSKVEYLNKILPSLGDSGIIYAKRPPWVTVKQDNNIAAFVVGTRLVIYTYSLADAYLDFRPLEQQTSIDRGFNLLAIGFLWRTATVKTQLDLVDWSTRNWGATQNMRSDISSTPEGDFFTFICGPKKNELTSTYVQCNEIFNQTFIPGYKPNSAP